MLRIFLLLNILLVSSSFCFSFLRVCDHRWKQPPFSTRAPARKRCIDVGKRPRRTTNGRCCITTSRCWTTPSRSPLPSQRRQSQVGNEKEHKQVQQQNDADILSQHHGWFLDRRRLLGTAWMMSSCGLIHIRPMAMAAELSSTRPTLRPPYAPTGALIPALHQQRLLQRALQLVMDDIDNKNSNSTALQLNLANILDRPETNQATAGSRQSVFPKALATSSVTSGRKHDATTAINDASKWFQRPLLSGPAFRTAMNIYTSNLRFADYYVLTASPAAKKQLIRNYNGLPDIKQVITADLDLRDLYRNQVQTLVEDAQAELYRLDLIKSDDDEEATSINPTVDLEELLRLLQSANEAFDCWLGLISDQDIVEANKQLDQMIQSSKSQSGE